jgi:hypothetical protein
VGSCAITIKRRRDPTPKFHSRNSDSARCDWEIEEVAEAALLPVAPTLRSGKLDRPVKYRCFRSSNIFDHTTFERKANMRLKMPGLAGREVGTNLPPLR